MDGEGVGIDVEEAVLEVSVARSASCPYVVQVCDKS